MKNHLITAAAACLFAAPASAGDALLWLPADNSGAERAAALLEKNASLRLTAALSSMPDKMSERLKALEKAGRLELALRPDDDPPMALLYYPAEPGVAWEGKVSTAAPPADPYFLGLRLSEARDRYIKAFKSQPQGLVPYPGGLAADMPPIARSLGVRWLASGPFRSTSAPEALDCDSLKIAPFAAVSAAAPLPPPGGGTRFFVFDERLDPTSGFSAREALFSALESPGGRELLTVSAALSAASSTSAAREGLSALAAPWTGDYTPFAGGPKRAGSLRAMSRTRQDLMLHLNAKGGNYREAKPAFEQYFDAEDPARLLLLGGTTEQAAEAESEIQAKLGNAYRLMEKAMPGWLFTGIDKAQAEEQAQDKMRVEAGAFRLSFFNSAAAPAVPDGAVLPQGADPSRVFKLESMEISWNEAAVTFRLKPAEAVRSRNPGGFSNFHADVYIDLNRRLRAGLSRGMDGRKLKLYPEDAWEYALAVSPGKAELFFGAPDAIRRSGSFSAQLDAEGAVTVKVPRKLLPGNPARWGYVAALLAPLKEGGQAPADAIAGDFEAGYYYAARAPRR